MNKIFKILPALALVASTSILVACGDDSSSSDDETVAAGFDLESSFEIALEKGMYFYNAKDSTLAFGKPVCKEGTLGNLVWALVDDEDLDSSKVYLSKSTVTVKASGKTNKYEFNGKKFPAGDWLNQETAKKSIQNAVTLTPYNVYKNVFRYDGKCFLKDFYNAYLKENAAIEEADSALSAFYKRFLAPSDEFSETTMLNDIRVSDCDEMSMFDGLVNISIKEFKESSGALEVSYASKTCSVEFNIRYAFDEDDCKAAFAEYEDSDAKKFDFKDYWKTVDYDDYCIEELILQMKKEQNIPLKKTAAGAEDAKAFASAIVDAVFVGIK